MIVVEHEIIHALFISSPNSNCVNSDGICAATVSHGPLFVQVVKNIFGHTSTTHELLGGKQINHNDEIIPTKLSRKDFQIGDNVYFINSKPTPKSPYTRFEGKITKIKKVFASVTNNRGMTLNIRMTSLHHV
jgi:hypothetical protein